MLAVAVTIFIRLAAGARAAVRIESSDTNGLAELAFVSAIARMRPVLDSSITMAPAIFR